MARIYQTYEFGEAQLKIALVHSLGMAQLAVCRVNCWGMAQGDAFWFITRDLQEATVRVKFCSEGEADLLICFVSTRGAAGWRQEQHRWRNRLG